MSQIEAASALPIPRLAIFTDFDGTLVELAETPEDIEVVNSLPYQLERVARELESAFAVLTGRDIADIDKYLAPLHLPVSGAHGTQRRRADGIIEAADPNAVLAAEDIAEAVSYLVDAHPGLTLKVRAGTVFLNFSELPEVEDEARIALEEAIQNWPDFSLVSDDTTIEARPPGVTKGQALRAFMREEPFVGRTPIFIGDGTTDEDAFIAAQDLGGVGIKLGEGETAARMRVADVASVHALIQGLGDIVSRDRESELH